MTNASLGKQARRALMAASAVTLGVLAWAGPAAADSTDAGSAGRVATSGSRLNVRSAPTTAAKVVRKIENGVIVRLICQVKGKKVNGHRRTTTMWNKISGGGYVSDGYVKRAKAPPSCASLKAAASASPVPNSKGWVRPANANVGGGFRTKARPDHDGVDISAKRYTRIRAAAAGTVIVAECNTSNKSCDIDGSPKVRGCGWYVDIQHAHGVVTRYCHLVKRPYVKVGDKVVAGQVIGRMGTSGNSSGPHLHFEVHVPKDSKSEAQPVNPVKFFKDMGLKLSAS